MPDGVSATLGVGLPKQAFGVVALTMSRTKLIQIMSIFPYSLPKPETAACFGMIGFLILGQEV